MLERFLIALIPLVSTPAPAAPVERVFAFANPVRELNSKIRTQALPFPPKTLSAIAPSPRLATATNSYSMIVCRILYGDMVHFLVLAKAYKSDNGNQTDTFSTNRTFRVGEDKKTIEESRSSSTANASRLDDGSVKTIYSSERFAQGAYSIAKSKRWSLGSLTETDFFGMNEDAGVDTTIMSARQITYSLPISREMFRGYLPDRVRLFFDNFRTRHISVVQLGEMLNKCGDCKQIKAQWTEGRRAARPGLEFSSKEDVAEMRPLKPCLCLRPRRRPTQSIPRPTISRLLTHPCRTRSAAFSVASYRTQA